MYKFDVLGKAVYVLHGYLFAHSSSLALILQLIMGCYISLVVIMII
jgi:hypothetical protein